VRSTAEFTGQIFAGRGVLPQDKLSPQIVLRALGALARRHTLAEVGQIVIGFAHHAPLDGALVAGRGRKGPAPMASAPRYIRRSRNRRRPGPVRGDAVERPEFRRLQVAGVERQRLAMIGNSLCSSASQTPPRIG
jgi:hypothetical protein